MYLRRGFGSIDCADGVRTPHAPVSSRARKGRALIARGLALSLAASGCAAPPASDARSLPPAMCRPAPSASPFEVIVLGSGGPAALGRAASSYVVRIDGVARILVDAGPGAFARIGEMGIDTSALDTVLLTHLHIDHSGDLPAIVKSRDLSTDERVAFRIFGPSGREPYPSTTTFVARLFGPDGAFAYLPSFRNTLDLQPHDLPLDASEAPRVVIAEPGWRVTSIVTDHGNVPSIAYRIEQAGHSVVFSGDLASKNDNLARLAEGADVLVYNAVVRDPPVSPSGLYALHTAPRRIGEVAAKARVGSVVLAHLSPAVDSARDEVVASIRTRYAGSVRFAEDCLRIDVK